MPQDDNTSILAAILGLTPNINSASGQLPPEILEYLRSFGAPTNENQTTSRNLMQPVGPEDFQAVHWTQGLAHMLDQTNRYRALGGFNRALMGRDRAIRTPATGINPPPTTNPPTTNPPRILRTNPNPNLGNIENLLPGSFSEAPNGRGAEEVASSGGLTGMLGRGLRNVTQAQTGDSRAVEGSETTGGVIPEQTTRNPTAGESLEIPGQSGSGVGLEGGTGAALPRSGVIDENGRLIAPGSVRLDENGRLTVDAPETPSLLSGINREGIGNLPPRTTQRIPTEGTPPPTSPPTNETPPTSPPTNETPPTVTANTPRITERELQRMIDENLPPPHAFRFGLTPDQEMALGSIRDPDRRKAMEDALTYQNTPQYNDVPNVGRHWVIPNNGNPIRGFIPHPRFDHVDMNGVRVPVVTVFDRLGRSRTFILEPGQTTPGPADRGVLPPSNLTPGNEPPQPAGEGNRLPTGNSFLDRGIFADARRIATEQTARNAAATTAAQGVVGEINEFRERGNTAQQTLSIVRMMEGLFEQMGEGRAYTEAMSGNFASQWLNFVRTVNGALVQAGRQPFFSEAPISAWEALQKLNTYLGSAAARQLTNRPTQFDFQAFLAANPGLESSPAGRRIMARMLRVFAERDVELGNAAGNFREEVARTGGTAGLTRTIQGVYDRHMTEFGTSVIGLANRGQINLPRGFRFEGRVYNGARNRPGETPASRNPSNWAEETGNR